MALCIQRIFVSVFVRVMGTVFLPKLLKNMNLDTENSDGNAPISLQLFHKQFLFGFFGSIYCSITESVALHHYNTGV